MFVVEMNGRYWNAREKAFSQHGTIYEDEGQAAEAAQEDAGLAAELPWKIVPAPIGSEI